MEYDRQGDSGDARDRSRKQGIEFGALDPELETHEYPTTTGELIDDYGDWTLQLPDGAQTLEEVLGVLSDDDERFDSPEAVREAIYLAAGSDAVGRAEYTDRGGMVQESGSTL